MQGKVRPTKTTINRSKNIKRRRLSKAGVERKPPQQRLLPARRRREQRGDEQAGAGAARDAGIRGQRQPPRVRAVPRAPREEGVAEGRRRRGERPPSPEAA